MLRLHALLALELNRLQRVVDGDGGRECLLHGTAQPPADAVQEQGRESARRRTVAGLSTIRVSSLHGRAMVCAFQRDRADSPRPIANVAPKTDLLR